MTPLDPEVAYRALASRDPRFDGRIFFGVTSTGVYCRPVCPARTPRRENVRLFPCAAAAAEAGFRPCLRCRPETAPHTPAWRGTEATVRRALRLIGERGLQPGGVPELAARLGVGERHLRRLFEEHLGASPLAVVQTRRVHFAKRLLDQTELPMPEVAAAAGFGSVRRFNAALRDVYGVAPRELRARARARRRGDGRGGPVAADGADVALRLATQAPYDWEGVAGYLAARAIPGVERVEAGAYRRTVSLEGSVGVVEVRPQSPRADGAGVVLRVPATRGPALAAAAARARRLFDLDADPAAIGATLGCDPALAPRLRARPGLRVPGAWSGFELAVRAILGQQVSVAGATTLAGRLARRFGTPVRDAGPGLDRLFPTPETLAGANVAAIGLPAQRARALRELAAAVASGRLDLDDPAGDTERVREILMALPGVGPWTAEYVAMRALGDPDALPASDLGLRRALAGADAPPLTAAQVAERAEAWRPWRAYGALALWLEPATAPTVPGAAARRRTRASRRSRSRRPSSHRQRAQQATE